MNFDFSIDQTDDDRFVGHFLCIFCGKNFNDSVQCDRHIDGHLTHQNCSSCDKAVILIGRRLYELHMPEKCLHRTNQRPSVTKHEPVDRNDLSTELIEIELKKCDRLGVNVEPRRSYRRRGKSQLEYSERESIDVGDPIAEVVQNCTATSLKCEICAAKFKSTQSLKRHMQRKHPVVPEFKCDVRFDQPKSLTEHKSVQGDPSPTVDAREKPSPIKCNLCCTEFKIKHTLTRHLHQKHNIPPEYKCKMCGIVCKKYQYLKDHLLTHGVAKRWICSWCGAGYHLKNNLKEHENSHTGERPHQCSECDKAFSRKALLRAHLVQHTGARPFQCPVADCQRTYAYYTDLTRHKRGTHGIMSKPHACNLCNRIFYERKFLRKHMETHMLPSK